MRARGIDISHWKAVKDWDAVYDSGVSFVGVKATEGNTYLDPKLRTHRDELRRRPFKLGIFYHFARSGSAVKQAERLEDSVGSLRDNERLCLDLEVCPTQNPDQAVEWLDDFFETLLNGVCSNRRPLLYTSKRIWRQIGNPEWSFASEVDLWAPRYNPVEEPKLPLPWVAAGWTFWQWSDSEKIPGIDGGCDANYFRGDEAELSRYARLGIGPEDVTPRPPVV